MKNLYLIRGVSGAGKTTFARKIANIVLSADDYFYERGKGQYAWNPRHLPEAHALCLERAEFNMASGRSTVAIANTFTRESEMRPYFELAEKYGYMVTSLIVENRHEGKSSHNVPEKSLQRMRDRFEIKL